VKDESKNMSFSDFPLALFEASRETSRYVTAMHAAKAASAQVRVKCSCDFLKINICRFISVRIYDFIVIIISRNL
jgi:hypothetical protein